MASDLKPKTQKTILEFSKRLQNNFREYNETVEDGKQHISLLVAHQTSLDSIKSANIEDTDTYNDNQDIKLKLDFNLKCNINLEEEALEPILEQQDAIFSSIMKECDKVFSAYQNAIDLDISLDDLTQGEVDQYAICKKVDTFDTFRKKFNDNHLARRYGLSYYNIGGDVNKLPKLWDTSRVKTIQSDLLNVTLK